MKKRAKAKPSVRGPRPEREHLKGRSPAREKKVDPGILSLRKVLLKFAGCMKGLPRDLADNHDHYIHGLPKK
ncbi:MAG: hypothetical protein K8T20_03590 [Planctomycetes bacterium]|nr:hypothetical protein [Planctomycetota bacterium]